MYSVNNFEYKVYFGAVLYDPYYRKLKKNNMIES